MATQKRSRGRPVVPKATAGDAESIFEKINYEFDKWDAKLANELGDLLDMYYQLAFTAEKENTKKAVMEKLIERAQKKVEEPTEDTLNPPVGQPKEKQEDKPVISLMCVNNDK